MKGSFLPRAAFIIMADTPEHIMSEPYRAECRRIQRECDDAACVNGIVRGDPEAHHLFFYEMLRRVICRAEKELFGGLMEYDDLVGEIWLYLRDDNWRRLRSFGARGGCSLRTWASKAVWRFCLNLSSRYRADRHRHAANICDTEVMQRASYCMEKSIAARIDVRRILSRMPNRRYAEIVLLTGIYGYTAAEASMIMQREVANPNMVTHRAQKQFAKYYTA